MVKAIFGVGGVGIAFGILLGMSADIEDNLPLLKITVTDIQICSKPDATTRPIQQDVFTPTQDVYVCGYLNIEEVDQRKVEIPLVFTWYYESNREDARAVQYDFESDGFFTALLDRPTSGKYQPGKYLVTVARAKAQLAKRNFEIVVE